MQLYTTHTPICTHARTHTRIHTLLTHIHALHYTKYTDTHRDLGCLCMVYCSFASHFVCRLIHCSMLMVLIITSCQLPWKQRGKPYYHSLLSHYNSYTTWTCPMYLNIITGECELTMSESCDLLMRSVVN